MKITGDSRKNHYLTRANILLIVVTLIAGMIGCEGAGGESYALTIASTTGGSVTTPGEGTFNYDPGAVIDLAAEAETGYRFAEWTGNVSTIADVYAAATNITMNGDYSITANFVAIYDLTVSSTEGGQVITPGEGTYTYNEGTVVSLMAEAQENYQFLDWTGDVGTIADVNSALTSITMNGDYFITANFQQTSVPVSILENPQGYPTPGLTPEYGGTLIVLHNYAPSNLGAFYLPGGWDLPQARPALEKLLGLGEDGQPVPQLATNWMLNESAMTITFALRQDVTFHDGTDFNAEAVEWNLENYRDYGAQHELDDMTDAVPNGGHEIELQFSTWDPNMIRSFMSSPGIMISPTYAQAHTTEEVQWHPVGTGPFEFVEYVDSIRTVYTKNDDYWQEGLPYLDGIEIHYISDPVARIYAFINEDGDALNEFSTSYALYLKNEGYEVLSRVDHIKGIVPNSAEPPFDNQNIREALAYAFNYTAEVEEIFDGQWTPTGQCALPGLTGWNSSMVDYPYNVTTAKSIMEAAGYNSTNRLACNLWYTDSDATAFYTIYQYCLADIYIDVTLNMLSRGPYTGKSGTGWDGLLEFRFTYNGFEWLYDRSLMMTMSPGSPRHVDIEYPTAYSDLYDAMLLETDPTTRETMYQQLNTMAIDEYCLVMPHFGYEAFTARQPYAHDFGWCYRAMEYLPEIAWIEQ